VIGVVIVHTVLRTAPHACGGHAVAMASTDPTTPGEPDAALARAGGLEIRGSAAGLLDDPLLLRVRGAGPDGRLSWRARYRDDDGRIWRSAAARAEQLGSAWTPAKETTGSLAALRSLRPVRIDVRAELPDGRAAARTVVRAITAEGVRTRRWRDGVAATLHVPAGSDPCATVLLDATTGEAQVAVATLAAPLLASRGVLVLAVMASRGHEATARSLAFARTRLEAMPAASEPIMLLTAHDPLAEEEPAGEPAGAVVMPPGVGVRDVRADAAADRALAWDALLARLAARPRERPAAP